MRAVVIAIVFGAAIAIWLMLSNNNSNDAAVSERFTPDKEDKRNSYSSDIMDAYKEAYGKYPQTEVLVHYRDAAMDGGLSLEEVKSRIKSDGGSPPGLKMPSEEAEAKIAAVATTPPRPGDIPYTPGVAQNGTSGSTSGSGNTAILPPQLDVIGLPSKLMALAVQLSSLAEEIKTAQTNRQGPRGIESFIAF